MTPATIASRAALLFAGAAHTPTDQHEEGPFYRPYAPWLTDIYPAGSSGTVVTFEGSVLDTAGQPIANATGEIWQADDLGRYDNDDPANLPAFDQFRCRARFNVGQDGRFQIRTVEPGNYKPEADDCWVRVKHLHFKFHVLGYEPLTTEVALLPDRYADTDALFNPNLVANLEPATDNGQPALKTQFEFVMKPISPRNYLLAAARANPVTEAAAPMGLMTAAAARSLGAHDAMPTRHIVRYGEVQIDVIAQGRGPLMVMLPSTGRDSEDFDDVAAGLAAKGYRVLRPQPRGVAGSIGPMTGVALRHLARDVAVTIEHEGAGKALVVGHAYGSWVARVMAVTQPLFVRGVVLAAAAAKPPLPPELSAALGRAADPTLPELERLQALRLAFFAPGQDPRPWLTGWHASTMAMQRSANDDPPRDDWWGGGDVPMLDLQAAADPWRPRMTFCDLREAYGKRVMVSVIANASHALIPEQPGQVVGEIVDWARRL